MARTASATARCVLPDAGRPLDEQASLLPDRGTRGERHLAAFQQQEDANIRSEHKGDLHLRPRECAERESVDIPESWKKSHRNCGLWIAREPGPLPSPPAFDGSPEPIDQETSFENRSSADGLVEVESRIPVRVRQRRLERVAACLGTRGNPRVDRCRAEHRHQGIVA